jgi:trimethylamine--corrinoid protein Co-methyltransferase
LAAASGGNDLIVNSGMYGTGMSISNEQLLLDNEMNRFAKRMMKGVEVSEETIAKDVIAEVGPRGDYLATDHTLDHLRTGEHIEPTVITGMNYENWKNAGAKNCTELASEQVITLLQNTNSGSITVEKSQKLDSILLEFDQELGES